MRLPSTTSIHIHWFIRVWSICILQANIRFRQWHRPRPATAPFNTITYLWQSFSCCVAFPRRDNIQSRPDPVRGSPTSVNTLLPHDHNYNYHTIPYYRYIHASIINCIYLRVYDAVTLRSHSASIRAPSIDIYILGEEYCEKYYVNNTVTNQILCIHKSLTSPSHLCHTQTLTTTTAHMSQEWVAENGSI